jgi:hypothetical protein
MTQSNSRSFFFTQDQWKRTVVNNITLFSISIPEKEHGRGDSPIVQVYKKDNEQDDYMQYNDTELMVNSQGDITVQVPSNPFFLTKILVM